MMVCDHTGVTSALWHRSERRRERVHGARRLYGEHDGAWIIVASKGGHTGHPGWYLNLVAHPTVQIQVGAARIIATARTARGAERAERWAEMAQIWPAYNDYQKATQREIPVVVLERA